jgi:opacity protein-like surface antigen
MTTMPSLSRHPMCHARLSARARRSQGATNCHIVIALVLAWLPARTRADNTQGVLIGNQAALTGGAVGAMVSDGSAVWHNPAGLAELQRAQLDASVSAIEIRTLSVPSFMQSQTETASANTMELLTIPAAVTYARHLAEHTAIGYGVFVPKMSDVLLRTALNGTTNALSDWSMSYTNTSSETYGGIGIGHSFSEHWNLGASLFARYGSIYESTQFAGGNPDDAPNANFLQLSQVRSSKQISLELGMGVQWKPDSRWQVGLAVRTPRLSLFGTNKVSSISTFAFSDGTDTASSYDQSQEDESGFGVGVATTMYGRGAIAYKFAPGGWVSAEADFRPAYRGDADYANRAVWNARIGGRLRLSPRVHAGLGFFTDRSSVAQNSPDAPSGLDFYGVSGGVELLNRQLLAEGSAAQDLVFSTTLALRYAYGFGEGPAATLPASYADFSNFTVTSTRAHAHELAVYFGSSLYF